MTKEGILKHRDLFNKWLDGEQIQFYSPTYKKWINAEYPTWSDKTEFRVKPTKIEFEDCSFNETEYCIDKDTSMIIICNTKSYDIDDRKGFFKDKEIAEAYAVLPQLIRLRDEYNDGWKPDWKDMGSKFSIENFRDDLNPLENCYYSRILVFKTKEVRDNFFNNHRDLLEIAKPLL